MKKGMKKSSKMEQLAEVIKSRSVGSRDSKAIAATSHEEVDEILDQADVPKTIVHRAAARHVPESELAPTAMTGAFTEARPSAPPAETKGALLVGGGRSGSLGAASQGLLAGVPSSQASASAAASARQLGVTETSPPV